MPPHFADDPCRLTADRHLSVSSPGVLRKELTGRGAGGQSLYREVGCTCGPPCRRAVHHRRKLEHSQSSAVAHCWDLAPALLRREAVLGRAQRVVYLLNGNLCFNKLGL